MYTSTFTLINIFTLMSGRRIGRRAAHPTRPRRAPFFFIAALAIQGDGHCDCRNIAAGKAARTKTASSRTNGPRKLVAKLSKRGRIDRPALASDRTGVIDAEFGHVQVRDPRSGLYFSRPGSLLSCS